MAQTATTPSDGESYYIYNVGQQKYLACDNGGLVLSDTPMAITVNKSTDDTDYYTLTSPDGLIGVTYSGGGSNGTIYSNGKGESNEWDFQTTATEGTYLLRSRYKASNKHWLRYSTITSALDIISYAISPSATALYNNASWQFCEIPDTETITFNEENTTCDVPNSGTYNVQLKRTFAKDAWNSLCLPFSIDEAQLKSQLGDDVKIAEYTKVEGNILKFTTVTSITAGKPYIIKPTKIVATDGYYTFSNISTFAENPEDVTSSEVTFHGSYIPTTVPSRAYVFGGNNKIYHLTSSMSMKGFRSYLTEDNAASAKTYTWTLDDETTGIDTINAADGVTFDIYNLSGQKVKTAATSTDGLPHGIYIINGKKVTK